MEPQLPLHAGPLQREGGPGGDDRVSIMGGEIEIKGQDRQRYSNVETVILSRDV